MKPIQELENYRTYIESLLQATEGLPPLAEGDGQHLLEELQSKAKNTLESIKKPVKIGVVGEFSAGKTLLLGALVGYADLLPVSEIPTTGNVTELHFLPPSQDNASAGNRTTIEKISLEYLSRQEAQECLRFILSELVPRAEKAQLPAAQKQALLAIQQAPRTEIDALFKWCQNAWASSQNPSLRYLLREAVLFLRSMAAFGTALSGRKFDVSLQAANEGLRLSFPEHIQTDGFESIPKPSGVIENLPQSLSSQQIRESFSLIRRCRVDVRLPKELWKMASLGGRQEYILYDFPGLGADSSGVRDTFLCQRELDEVHTILILLNGQRPGSGGALDIVNMMQRSRPHLRDQILVGISRFDQASVPLPVLRSLVAQPSSDNDPFGEGSIIPLEEESKPALREADLLAHFDVLKRLIGSAEALTTRKDRILFLSPVLGMGELLHKHPGLHLASDGFLPQLRQAITETHELKLVWRQVVEALKNSGESGEIIAALEAFSKDGGLSALHALLQRHVAEHGLKQQLEQIQRETAKVDQLRQRLVRLLKEERPSSTPPRKTEAEQSFQDHIRALLRLYHNVREKFQQTPPEFRLPQQGQDRLLSDALREEVSFRVFQWPQWNQLFQKVSPQGYVENQPKAKEPNSIIPGAVYDEESSFPTEGQHFFQSFVLEASQLEAFTQGQMKQALQRWLEELSIQAIPQKAALQTLFSSAGSSPDREIKNALAYLRSAVEPTKMLDGLLKQCGLALEAKKEGEEKEAVSPHIPTHEERWTAHFPLSRSQKLPWDTTVPARSRDKESRHQSYFLRLRGEMIASLSRQLSEQASQINKHAVSTLVETFGLLASQLLKLLNHASLLQRMTEGTPSNLPSPASPPSATPSPYALLENLTSPLQA